MVIFNTNGGIVLTDAPDFLPIGMAMANEDLVASEDGSVPNVLKNHNPGIEIYEFYLDLEMTQSAGTYDPETNTLLLNNFRGGQKITLYMKVSVGEIDFEAEFGPWDCGWMLYLSGDDHIGASNSYFGSVGLDFIYFGW